MQRDKIPDDLPQLTPAEREVMQALWRAERLSAREIHDLVGTRCGWTYSTTRTTVERMVRKGLVTKGAVHGLHVYAAAITRAAGVARMVRDFAREVLGSGPAPVVAFLDRSDALSEQEMAELREMLGEPEETRG